MSNYILALDVGTSFLHCLLADSLGRPIATASAPMRYFTPDGCPPLAKEFDPESVLDTMGQLTVEVLKGNGIRKSDISAISVTSQRQGVVFLDDKGKEVYSGPNVDLRAIFEGAALDEELGGEIYATTGHFPSMLLAPARLRWFRECRPSIYDKTCTILTVAGWLAYRLTGNPLSEPSLDAEAGLLDIRTRQRSPGLMDRQGVPASLLPPLSAPGTSESALSRQMADLWGLRQGIPVVIAGPDTQCGLVGMGLMKEGQAGVVIGWSGALQMLTSRPRYDEGRRTWLGCYPQDGLWVAESNLGDAGNAYRWLKDILLGTDGTFQEAERLASQAPAAAEGVAAFLGPGPVSSFKAGLRLGGLFFPTPLSFQETSREQLLRSALESIAYSVKANLGTLVEVTGLKPEALYLGGGMASSRTLATTLSSVLVLPVRRSTLPSVSARGAALAAAVSTNPSVTLEQAAEAATVDCEEVKPGRASEIAQYEGSYHQWLDLYERLGWNQELPAGSPRNSAHADIRPADLLVSRGYQSGI